MSLTAVCKCGLWARTTDSQNYDGLRYEEEHPDTCEDTLGLPDVYLMFFNTMIIFDNINKTCKVVHAPMLEGRSVHDAYDSAMAKIRDLCERLRAPDSLSLADDITPGGPVTLPYASNMEKDYYMKMVEKCKEYIRAGDIFQVVPSQRLTAATDVDPFNIYRALRVINPSPYMFFVRASESERRPRGKPGRSKPDKRELSGKPAILDRP